MRLPTIRLIARRELRDLLRDRRSVMIMFLLPAIIYPAFVLVGLAFAMSIDDQKSKIGVVNIDEMPKKVDHPEAVLGGGAYLAVAERQFDMPALFDDGQFSKRYYDEKKFDGKWIVVPLDNDSDEALKNRQVDAMIVFPQGMMKKFDANEKVDIRITGRQGDEASKMAIKRAETLVGRWKDHVKGVRFARAGLPSDFDNPVNVVNPNDSKEVGAKAADELRDALVKFLPFLIVMWTLAGALQPAVDVTAGEKERGTMETLLISPTKRSEIVAGKFAAVFVFSYGSALWNLFWIALGATILNIILPVKVISVGGIAWTVLLALPLAALFSALAIGMGAFARSTKEGQYYLIPMMLITLPLTLYSMTPGLKLTPFLSAIPISGLSMILQNLLATSGEPITPITWALGLGSLLVCVVLSLWWAARQFEKESVLFRVTQGFSMKQWWKQQFNKD